MENLVSLRVSNFLFINNMSRPVGKISHAIGITFVQLMENGQPEVFILTLALIEVAFGLSSICFTHSVPKAWDMYMSGDGM